MAVCYGDGLIVIKIKNGNMVVIDCSYSDSYPFYINYLYDQTGRYSNWIQNHNQRNICQTILSPDGDLISTSTVESNTERIEKDLGLIRLSENRTFIEISNKDDIEYLAIMSDGIHSFYETIITNTSKCNKSLNYIDVLTDLLDFKNFNTSFVQRRMNKFRKNCIKKNWGNADDVSLAVIYLGE